MPGITGLITAMPRGNAEALLKVMTGALRHNDSYRTGQWTDESLGVYIAWAVPQLSHQPLIRNRTKTRTLVFAGEHFYNGTGRYTNEDEDTSIGQAGGIASQFQTDPNFPGGLNGRFQGLIADSTAREVVLFNDRFGQHRLYYHSSGEAFYFAAEAKALVAALPSLRQLNDRSLADFIYCGCVLDNRTLFQGIDLLPPGAAWRITPRLSIERRSYFLPEEWESQPPLEVEPFYAELRNTFAQALPRYFIGSTLKGVSVTGGLDTRMIMAWQRETQGTLRCYSFGSMFRECRDVQVGRRVATTCHQPHHTITVGKEFLANFHRYAERSVFLSDGTVDVSRSPDLYVQERAGELAPVRISGTYGGDILRGVSMFRPRTVRPSLFDAEVMKQRADILDSYATARRHRLSDVLFHQSPQRGVDALEQTQLTVRLPFLDNDLVRLSYRLPIMQNRKLADQTYRDFCLRLIADGYAPLGEFPTDRGVGGSGRSWSTLGRLFSELSFKCEYAYDYGMPQWAAVADHIMKPLHLERVFLGRHKFYHFRVWYRDTLAGYLKDLLLDRVSISRPYLERGAMENIVTAHTAGVKNYTRDLHCLLTLELVHRVLL